MRTTDEPCDVVLPCLNSWLVDLLLHASNKQTHIIIVLLIYPTMKAVVFASLIGSAAAFAPAPTGKMAS